MKDIPLNERLIFALDVDSLDRAKEWVERLGSDIGFFKVGLQLFLAGGFPVVDWIVNRGYQVMLDLKLFDIPETVGLAMKQLRGRGATFVTVHGNAPILEAAVAERGSTKVLAVTVLTSFGKEDMIDMFGHEADIEQLVLSRARKALRLNCDGIVSSGLEAKRLRSELGDNLLIVTPGIRPGVNRDVIKDDQKRIVTAMEAIKNGADYIVVGRPISTAKDPLSVVRSIHSEISKALASG
jgi:orotidine-5'-phosphate decarboxylase